METTLTRNKRDFCIGAGLFLCAMLIRLVLLNDGLWYPDAVIAAMSVDATYSTGVLHYMHGVGYPGNVLIITLIYSVLNIFTHVSTEFVVLFSSAFFGSLSVVAIYFFVRKISDSTFVGLCAALILNFFPVYLSTSTYGTNHQLGCFLMIFSFYLAILASESNNLALKLFASTSLGLAASVRLESLGLVPLFFLFYWKNEFPFSLCTNEGHAKFKMNQKGGSILKDFVYLTAPMFIILLISYLPMLLSEHSTKLLMKAFSDHRWLGFWVPGITTLVIEWVSVSMTPLGWILLAGGLVTLFFKKDKYVFLIIWIWCAYFFIRANTPSAEDRHTIAALAGFNIAMAFGLEWVYNRIHKVVGIAILLVLIAMMSNVVYPILEYRAKFCGPKAFAYAVRDTVKENSVVIAMDVAYHLQYYGRLKTIDHPLDGDNVKISQNIAEIKGYLDNGINVYLVSSAFLYDSTEGLSYQSSSGYIYDSKTMKIYTNFIFNPIWAVVKDKYTGESFSLHGKWQLELCSNFMVVPIKEIDNEDWHKKSVVFGKFKETLFQVIKRHR